VRRCGCVRDPDRDNYLCTTVPQAPCERWVAAGAQAARHVLHLSYTPLLEEDVLWVLWCRGGGDRALAEDLYALVAGDG
jgi:hypothetical protein